MSETWVALRIVARILGATAISVGAAAAFSAQAQAPRVDARAEIAQVLFAATATQAAAARAADDRLREARAEIDRLRAQGARARASLAQAQERYVADLAGRDRAFAQEIAVLRQAAQDIASTPEGAAALARFNAGDEAGALAVLDQLVDARERARQARANVETAAERRRVARLAYDAQYRNRVDRASVIARFEEVVRLDPDVHSDWVALRSLYDLERLFRLDSTADAIRAGERAVATAPSDLQRADALYELGGLLRGKFDYASARSRYEESLVIARRALAADPDSHMLRFQVPFTLIQLGEVLVELREPAGARARFEEALDLTTRFGDEGAAIEARAKIRDVARAQGDSAYARRMQEQIALAEQQLVLRRRDEAGSGQQGPVLQVHALQDYGNLLSRQGDLAPARAEHEEALAIVRRLAAGDPGHARELGAALERFADALLSRGDFARAITVFDEHLQLRRRSAAAEPGDAQKQADLAQTLRYRAGALIELGDLANARTACAEAVEISKRIAEAERGTARLMTDYALALACLGDALRAQDDIEGARARYEASRDIGMNLLDRPPAERTSHVPWHLALVVFDLSEISLAQGRRQEALADLDRVRRVAESYADRLGGDQHHGLYRWVQLGAEFRIAQAREDSAGVQRAITRLRELDEAGWQPLHHQWIKDLRALSRAQRP